MKNGRDGGFIYWKLNYRKKFIRTLWTIPVVIFLSIQLFVTDFPPRLGMFLWVLLVITLTVQLTYTYVKWKSER